MKRRLVVEVDEDLIRMGYSLSVTNNDGEVVHYTYSVPVIPSDTFPARYIVRASDPATPPVQVRDPATPYSFCTAPATHPAQVRDSATPPAQARDSATRHPRAPATPPAQARDPATRQATHPRAEVQVRAPPRAQVSHQSKEEYESFLRRLYTKRDLQWMARRDGVEFKFKMLKEDLVRLLSEKKFPKN